MKIEEQRLTREQLFALRDYHAKAADDALGRIILAILAGAGSALVFLANSPIPTASIFIRALGIVSGGALLGGVVSAFGALLSSRQIHLVEGLGYSLRIQKKEFETDFAPYIEDALATETLNHQETNLADFDRFKDQAQDQAQRLVWRAAIATSVGIAIVAGVYIFAPPAPKNATPTTSPVEQPQRKLAEQPEK